MEIALKEAKKGMHNNEGGPFGAVIVKKKKVIAKAHNEVLKKNDPTCHAEILAIRRASEFLNDFSLVGCEIYTTSYPCPMCFSAILWARIGAMYYGTSPEETEKVGFDDAHIHHILCRKPDEGIAIESLDHKECLELLREWELKPDRILY